MTGVVMNVQVRCEDVLRGVSSSVCPVQDVAKQWGVANEAWCRRKNDDLLVRERIPVEAVALAQWMVPLSLVKLKRPSACSFRFCRSLACWNKTMNHVAKASIVVVRRRLVGSVVVPSSLTM